MNLLTERRRQAIENAKAILGEDVYAAAYQSGRNAGGEEGIPMLLREELP